jgi:DNA (cytosine-5)-methyltransferase 1
MRLLDLFCGAGMASDGYVAAGFEVVGVDNKPQPHYPYQFVQADALGVLDRWQDGYFQAIHASPPCQIFTRAKHLRDAQGSSSKEQIDLLTPTLAKLKSMRVPWIVENVEGAKSLMPDPVRVCGSSFCLEVQRHRLFSSNIPLKGTGCHHNRFPPDPVTGKPRPWGVYHVPKDSIPKGGRTARSVEHGRSLFQVERQIPWTSLKEGFPPAYTQHIGSQVMAWLS